MKILCFILSFFTFAQPGILFPLFDVLRIFLLLSFVTIIVFFIQRSSGKIPSVNLPQNKYIWGLMVIFTISEAQFMWMSGTIDVFLFWFKKVLLFWVVLHTIDNIEDFKKLVWASTLAVCVLIFYGWSDYLAFKNIISDNSLRLVTIGNYNNANSFALLLTIFIPLIFSLMEAEPTLIRKLFLFVILLTMVISCVYTKSRGGNIGMLLGVSASILVSRSFLKTKGAKVFVLIILGAIFSIYAVTFILTRPDAVGMLGGGGESSSGDRLMAWRAAIRMFIDHPFLGVGWRHFTENWHQYGMDRKLLAHNTILSVLAETGILGLICYLGILVTTLKQLYVIRKEDHQSEDGKQLFILSQGVLISFLCFLFNTSFSVKEHDPSFWLLITLSAILANIFLHKKQKLDNLKTPRKGLF